MSRQTSFQDKHNVEYGLQPVERLVGSVITTMQCLFYVHIRRKKHEGPGVKRQRTKNTFLDKDKDSLQFVISKPTIVNDVVGDLFFHSEEDEEDDASKPITKANAMKLFKLQDDESYLVTIKNSLQFDLAIRHVSVGLSFRQTSKVIEQHHSATKNAKLNGLNDHVVGQFVRILLTVSLQIISDVLTDPAVWAFSLAIDAGTHLGVPLLDQRIHMCLKGMLYNLHLVLVPFFE
ncbi:unnamed protein product [Sphagnum troendelagicum]|uniref:Uncharacterized protein n=1 Tax=Sphagnum troendelagicum TaxID=128251 RepID=A0ABP0UX46_9BRYO